METLGEFGVFFILFAVGLEFSPDRIKEVKLLPVFYALFHVHTCSFSLLNSNSSSCKSLGNLSTRRSRYHGCQPEVFLQHDNHCACRDVLELLSRTSKCEFSG